jgi:uncharacterized protein (DUF1330 family)
VRPILKKFGGEFLAFGRWHVLHGEPAYDNGMIVTFPDKETALAWYSSPECQRLLEIRDKGLTAVFASSARETGYSRRMLIRQQVHAPF